MKPDVLSPSEEISLRRVHLGIAKAKDLLPRDLARLVEVGLVIQRGNDVALTDAGQHRLRSLPKTEEQLTKLMEELRRPAGKGGL